MNESSLDDRKIYGRDGWDGGGQTLYDSGLVTLDFSPGPSLPPRDRDSGLVIKNMTVHTPLYIEYFSFPSSLSLCLFFLSLLLERNLSQIFPIISISQNLSLLFSNGMKRD